MRKLAFRLPFAVVAVATSLSLLGWLLALIHARPNLGGWYWLLQSFAHPIPSIARNFLPPPLSFVVFLLFAGLVLRRLYLFVRSQSFSQPPSYNGIPFYLLAISSVSLVLGLSALALSMAFHVGSGVPAGMLLGPVILLAPLAIAWGEIMAIRSYGKAAP